LASKQRSAGALALVGAYNHTVNSHSRQGAAYVFVWSGTTRSQEAELTASDEAVSDEFGYSVALAGNTAGVGSYMHKVGTNTRQGSARVFVQSGSTWTQQTEITASDGQPAINRGMRSR
jgi:hypothetical protein